MDDEDKGDHKVLRFTRSKMTATNPPMDLDVLATLDEFIGLIQHHNAKSIAAVALTNDNQVIDTWHAKDPVQMLGAMELLKSSLMLHIVSNKSDYDN